MRRQMVLLWKKGSHQSPKFRTKQKTLLSFSFHNRFFRNMVTSPLPSNLEGMLKSTEVVIAIVVPFTNSSLQESAGKLPRFLILSQVSVQTVCVDQPRLYSTRLLSYSENTHTHRSRSRIGQSYPSQHYIQSQRSGYIHSSQGWVHFLWPSRFRTSYCQVIESNAGKQIQTIID